MWFTLNFPCLECSGFEIHALSLDFAEDYEKMVDTMNFFVTKIADRWVHKLFEDIKIA